MHIRTLPRLLAGGLALTLLVAACGSDDSAAEDDTTTTGAGAASDLGTPTPSGETLTLGYSAWPGWFPLAVAKEAGIFDQVGLKVDLRYFTDYISSLDALATGQIDANTQTLNDTMFSVASGSPQTIVVVNDNSTGNDAIICDESVGDEIDDLKGKTIAAEEGVVDHFLLLQGLESVGLTQDDIDFRGALTADAAAAFAGGEFDCVGVFAPFTTQALERKGSHVVFSSADFPGTIADHIVVSPDLVKDRPDDVQALVDAWYLTLQWIDDHPDEALDIMAKQAETTVDDYKEFAAGTTIFSADDALKAFEESDEPTSLKHTADLINPFMVASGLSKAQADLTGLFDPSFTQDYAERAG